MLTINPYKRKSSKNVVKQISLQVVSVGMCLFLSSLMFTSQTMGKNQTKSSCCDTKKDMKDETVTLSFIPDVEVTNQDGEKLHFYSDLVKDKVVAINFIFTTCTTVCPPMGVTFAQLQNLMDHRLGKDFNLITVSIDPNTDTPERLKAWGKKFRAKSGWTFVTGKKQEIDTLLKSLKVFTPIIKDHSPIILIGSDSNGEWTRTNGITPPAKLAGIINKLEVQQVAITPEPEDKSPAHNYFTDVTLVNQDSEEMQFYSDLLKDKTVVINAFFTECTTVCPVVTQKFAEIQESLGDHLGNDVHLISMSVDPIRDTPARLKKYANKFHAKPGWHFITGKKDNMEFALKKLGQYVDEREKHSTVVIIGNERTGLWKKAAGLANTKDIIKLVEEVRNDNG